MCMHTQYEGNMVETSVINLEKKCHIIDRKYRDHSKYIFVSGYMCVNICVYVCLGQNEKNIDNWQLFRN